MIGCARSSDPGYTRANHDDIGETPPLREERSVASLFGDLARESSRLLRQEIALARAELVGKVGQLGPGAVKMLLGGLITYGGFLAVLGGAILGLARVMPAWLAALIVGVVVVLIGAVVMIKGRRDVALRSLVADHARTRNRRGSRDDERRRD